MYCIKLEFSAEKVRTAGQNYSMTWYDRDLQVQSTKCTVLYSRDRITKLSDASRQYDRD
jgi:hypothetical protein